MWHMTHDCHTVRMRDKPLWRGDNAPHFNSSFIKYCLFRSAFKPELPDVKLWKWLKKPSLAAGWCSDSNAINAWNSPLCEMEIFHPDFGFPINKTPTMKNLSQFACEDRPVVTALGKEPLMLRKKVTLPGKKDICLLFTQWFHQGNLICSVASSTVIALCKRGWFDWKPLLLIIKIQKFFSAIFLWKLETSEKCSFWSNFSYFFIRKAR